jgi:hypothetical protein
MIELNESELYTIKNNKIEKLNTEELEKYRKLVEVFKNLEENIKFLYRGDNFTKIKEKLNSEDILDALNKIFKLGEKANNLIMTSNIDNNGLFRIDRVDNRIFEEIFTMISEVFNRDNLPPKLKNFILSNNDFCDFFKNIDNKRTFLESLSNSDKRIFIKDYYMAFLHTVGNVINEKSYFLSTTESLNIANKFSITSDKNDGIIFCYFINKPFISHGIFAKNKGYLTKEMEKNISLPKYNPLHEKEEEFSIRGGFLPHYIFYVTFNYKRKRIILLNPYIFLDDFYVDDLLSGFPVDQENFIEILKNTKYKGYYQENEQFEL